MSIVLTDHDKQTLRTAAYGAVSLLAAAGAAGGSPHRIATDGSIALASATGPVGHVLADQSAVKVTGKSVAEIADQVLPALVASVVLLEKQDPAEADNFRSIVDVAIQAATGTGRGEPSPTMAAITRQITTALTTA
ncbi:hypothetical protein ACFQY4_14365 [Catellatospora bangladeshensis]|uniref:D-alanyl-D-alanine carboxypeptidase n=1 Tax=Catellatospora bangladeshensis TaxID=310355 RepID=A0A8J3JTI3_9ACTN|nr:hypothetical protein [Catellatospora bangladeshensis]GIF83494.1 hypothetical protein Cba03nite_48430 [Catellatospora bangladeshensis]